MSNSTNDNFSVRRTSANRLVVTESRIMAFWMICLIIVFIIITYISIFGSVSPENLFHKIKEASKGNMALWLLLALLFPLRGVIGPLRIMIHGEELIIDGDLNEIYRNKVKLAYFKDIKAIQVRRVPNCDGPDDFRASLVLEDDKEIYIKQSLNHNKIFRLADAMTDILKVEIILN